MDATQYQQTEIAHPSIANLFLEIVQKLQVDLTGFKLICQDIKMECELLKLTKNIKIYYIKKYV
jgi:hypothetical protein